MRRFVTYSAIGGVVSGLRRRARLLARRVALLSEHIELVLIAIVAISLVPISSSPAGAGRSARDTRYDEESERLEVLRRAEDR